MTCIAYSDPAVTRSPKSPNRDLAEVSRPVTVLAARYDLLADRRPPTVAAGVPPTSHFLPVEAPHVIGDEPALLIEAVAAAERALTADSRTSS